MRILILSWEYPPRIIGGISRVVYYLAKELGRLENEVTVITVKDENSKSEEIDGNVAVYRIDPQIVDPIDFVDGILQMNYRIIAKAVSLISGGRAFDVIHLHDWLVAYAGNVLKEIYPNLPFICTFHSTEYGRNSGIHNNIQNYIRNVEQTLVSMSDKVIVNSGYMKSEVTGQLGAREDNVRVIPNGIDVTGLGGVASDPETRRRYSPDGDKIILFVGRLVAGKGVYVLLNAVPKVLKSCPGVRFVIAGKGPELDNLKEQASRMGISSRVSLPGFIPEEELFKLYKCADIAVFPSLYEPFGIVALEGMVARVPVVASDTGGFGQIIEHRVNGMKFEAGNPDKLAECIIELLTDPELAMRIVDNAAETLSRFYRWEDIAKQTLEVYRSVAET